MESKIDIILKKHNADFLSYIENNNGFSEGFDFISVFKEIEENLKSKEDVEILLKLNKDLEILFYNEILKRYYGKIYVNFNNEIIVLCK
jgi:hypothetical protein